MGLLYMDIISMKNKLPDLVAMKELCETFSVHRSTIHSWLKNEKTHFPKPIKIAKELFWDRSELAAYIKKKKEEY